MALILLDAYLHDGIFSLPPFTGNWRDEVTIEADRARRVSACFPFLNLSSGTESLLSVVNGKTRVMRWLLLSTSTLSHSKMTRVRMKPSLNLSRSISQVLSFGIIFCDRAKHNNG